MLINQNAPFATIKAWQTFLQDQGYDVGTPDGLWGPHTAAASKAFQTANHLEPDGLIGSASIKAATSKGFVLPTAANFAPAGTLNAVFDISHLNANVDLAKAKAAGMLGVFHKATQSGGTSLFQDKAYPIRRQAAKAAGLLWGAYHFGTSGDGAAQANAFLAYAQPDDNTLLVLDFERCTTTGESTMTLEEATAFIQTIKNTTGKYPGIYGGSLLRELLANAPDSILTDCWLWIAQYATQPHLPNGWSDYTFWQFTDGTNGPGALPIDGVGACDRDLFRGTAAELRTFWLG